VDAAKTKINSCIACSLTTWDARTMMPSKPFHRTRFLLGSGFLLTLLTFGCRGAPAPKEEEESPPAQVKAEPAKETDITQTIELVGGTQPLPNHAARISAQVNAPVKTILKDAKNQPILEGQRVSKGQVIVQLDDRLIQEQKTQAEIARDQAKNNVDRLRSTKEDKSPLVSKSVSPYEWVGANLTLKDAESKLKSLNDQLKYYSLTAPIDGRLGRIQVMPGQNVSPGTPIADVIDLQKEIDVLCFVPPYLVKQLELKQKARLRIGAGLNNKEDAEKKDNHDDKDQAEKKEGEDKKKDPDKKEGAEMKQEEEEEEFEPEGEVVLISDLAEADTGAFAVKVRFHNEEMQLRANLLAHVYVSTQTKKKTWTIPEAALMEDQDPPAVIVVQEEIEEHEGKKEKKLTAHILQVKVGLRDRVNHRVEILSLEAGEKKKAPDLKGLLFVTEGGNGLHDDDPVKLEEEKEEKKKEEEKKEEEKKKD
jgi:RND family efflux transporter MFP subunit